MTLGFRFQRQYACIFAVFANSTMILLLPCMEQWFLLCRKSNFFIKYSIANLYFSYFSWGWNHQSCDSADHIRNSTRQLSS